MIILLGYALTNGEFTAESPSGTLIGTCSALPSGALSVTTGAVEIKTRIAIVFGG